FRQVKRVPDTIKIFDIVQKEVPSKLILVGDGPDRSECERLVRQLNLMDKVKFLGKQDGLVEILNASDIFLIPSQSESVCLAAHEEMGSGIAVIYSSVGGLLAIVTHNECGFIAKIENKKRIEKYAVYLLTNEKKYNVFS